MRTSRLLLVLCLSQFGEVRVIAAPTEAKPATEKECRDFAAELEKAAIDDDRKHMDRLLPLHDFIELGVRDVKLPGNKKESFLAGLFNATKENKMVTQIRSAVKNGGSYKLLRIAEVDKQFRARFRLINEQGMYNYHDVIVIRRPDGRLVAEDISIFLAGEKSSQTLRRLILPGLIELDEGGRDKLSAAEKAIADNLEKTRQLNEANAKGDYGEAVAIYKSLPRELREEKVFLLTHLRAAYAVDEREYTRTLADFRRLFPSDPAIDFISIDHFLLKKKFDEALRCVDAADKALGGDPYLLAIRANILIEMGKLKEAQTAAEKAVELEPTLPEAYWSRINVALRTKNYQDTLVWLKKIAEKTDQKIADLTTVEGYAGFVKSNEHAEWLKWYESRKKK